MSDLDFESFPKIPRLRRESIVTEKIDGTNAQVYVTECLGAFLNDGETRVTLDGVPYLIRAGSRNRWLTPEGDNYGFARWVEDNAWELVKLGPGRHFGEWYGRGINRGYGLDERRFALFNTGRWLPTSGKSWHVTGKHEPAPECCEVVPVLSCDTFGDWPVVSALWVLDEDGSAAVPGYGRPEGVVVYHVAARHAYKVLIEGDHRAKTAVRKSHSEAAA